MGRVILILLVLFAGFWLGKSAPEKALPQPEKEGPILEPKSFVVVIYAYNQALWCERSLRSVFEQAAKDVVS